MPVSRGATILHVDLDAFFAAVEQRDHPELRGPAGHRGWPSRETAAWSARPRMRPARFGVRSAMPLRTAAALCPDGVFVPVRGDRYARGEPRVHGHPAALDATGGADLHRRGVPGRGRDARAAWHARSWSPTRSARPSGGELGLTASVGVASTRLVAKIASDLRKPDGLVVVPEGTEADFLAPLPIWRLWGVGEQTRRALADYGVQTIGDLAVLPADVLLRRFGAHGVTLADRARGIDPTPVGDRRCRAHRQPRAHVRPGHSRPGGHRADAAGPRRRRWQPPPGRGRQGRDGGREDPRFDVRRPAPASGPCGSRPIRWTRSSAWHWRSPDPRSGAVEVRLLGVVASSLTEREQLSLFADAGERRRRVTAATDKLRHRFGPGTIVRARLLGGDTPEPFARDHLSAPEAPRIGRPPPIERPDPTDVQAPPTDEGVHQEE